MSYVMQLRHSAPTASAARQQYPLLPLAQVPSPTPATLDPATKRLLVIIGLLLLGLIIWSMMSKKKPVTRNAAAKRLTTPELAAHLYSRLEQRKGTSPATLRSLAAYASKR